MNTLLLRADATHALGMGHVSRCVALAGSWRAAGGRAVFVSAVDAAPVRRLIESRADALIDVPAIHPDPADLRLVLATASAAADRPWVVVDGYHFDGGYHSALRASGLRTVVLDDTQPLARYDADIVVNPNVGAETRAYETADDTQVMAGVRYALLRDSLRDARASVRTERQTVESVLVTCGAADSENVTVRVLDAIAEARLHHRHTIVLAGPLNRHLESIRDRMRQRGLTGSVEVAPANVAETMARADLAISAGGTTALELLFLGIPTIVLETAANQRDGVRAMTGYGAAMFGGCASTFAPSRLAELLRHLYEDGTLRNQLAERGRQLVDGTGSERVVDALGAGDVRLRRAEPRDAEALWRMANDPEVRRQGFRPQPIPLSDHLQWYSAKLASSDAVFWVFDAGDGDVAGLVRYERSPANDAVIGFSVAAEHRQHGYGTRLLASTWRHACRQLGVPRVKGIVFETNTPSLRAFEAAGFRAIGREQIEGVWCRVFEREDIQS